MRNEAENVALLICTIKQLYSDTNKYCFWIVWKYLLFLSFKMNRLYVLCVPSGTHIKLRSYCSN